MTWIIFGVGAAAGLLVWSAVITVYALRFVAQLDRQQRAPELPTPQPVEPKPKVKKSVINAMDWNEMVNLADRYRKQMHSLERIACSDELNGQPSQAAARRRQAAKLRERVETLKKGQWPT